MKDKGTFDRIIDTMAFVAGILLVAAVFIVCIDTCMRYFFHKPQVWTVEICEYILFGIAFLGAPWLLKLGGHISVDVVTERLGSRSQGRLRLLSMGSGVLVSAIICWFSLATAWDCFKSGVLVTKTLTLP
jgi:TRAP-type C4-dicarboxylate transport system permease small subunit